MVNASPQTTNAPRQQPTAPQGHDTTTHNEPPRWMPNRRIRVLHLFSGLAQRPDGVAATLQSHGVSCDDKDILNTWLKDQDLADDATWGRIRSRIKAGDWDIVLAGPECGTFCPARRLPPPRPPVLRSLDHLYGFPKSMARELDLIPSDFEDIRMGNLLAERTAEAGHLQMDGGRAFIFEQPAPWDGHPHMFMFKSFQALVERGARHIDFDQCQLGGESTKPTRLLYAGVDIAGSPFASLQLRCQHPKQWVDDRKGGQTWAAHPPLRGRREGTAEFATHAAAIYPGQLCRWLAYFCSLVPS